MATMKQVAERAGVSISSVSHVLNGTRHVSDEVRRRIEDAMQALSYVPSAVARSLKHNVTRTLGIMLPNNSNPYFAELIHSIEDRCYKADYNVVLCNSDDDPVKQSVYLRVLMEKRVDGLIVMSSGDSPDLPELLSRLKVPLVLVDRQWASLDCDTVTSDHRMGAYLATRHLIELGHREIACIAGPEHLAPSKLRTAGWREALAEAGLEPGPLVFADFTSHGGYDATRRLLQSPYRPQAIFACNDLMAIGALCAAHETGLVVPHDLSVVGFDDIELAAFTCPPLTTVAQPKQRIGEVATELLFERLHHDRTEPCKIALQPTLCLRASSAPPRAKDKH
ncbi:MULTISPECIES: LacI family DNA-binding transcriptional regulator [unclassified Paludibacterium]|uniref:LacI family DNA-binding transcriptional regulator n=1 Tax=unclassified Paludibacterium TaxID=2618429 RepID=UPI001C03A975|nr:LacI family DNA-binding transcriptional regulator [Paludibacterium sp. B53371]BEV71436.1 LacI family DNA-binding transcriptional regulator [Paludibacterium sp. THUN1379]